MTVEKNPLFNRGWEEVGEKKNMFENIHFCIPMGSCFPVFKEKEHFLKPADQPSRRFPVA